MKPRVDKAPSYRAESSMPPVARAGQRIACSSDVWGACRDITSADQEHFICLDLDSRHRLIGKRVVAIGTVHGVEIHPREVFRGAMAANAAALIVVHNHPSGDPNPSAQDVKLTARLREAGELLGVPLLDHVVVAREGWVSFQERGWA